MRARFSLACPDFCAPKLQFPNRNAGNKHLIGSAQVVPDRRVIREKGDDDVGVQEVFTIHSRQPVRSPLLWPGA